MIRPLAILGPGPVAADLALRRVLRDKENSGPLIVVDWIGRAAPLLHAGNEGTLAVRPLVWCDLANRRQPVALFRLERSEHLRPVLTDMLRAWREATHSAVDDDMLAWGVEVAFKLAEDGALGLGAWYRALTRPKVGRWSTGAPPASGRSEGLLRLITWALRFPAVYALSEAPTRISLPSLLQGPRTVWIEATLEHFEAAEHQLLRPMVDAVIWDALRATRPLVDPRKPGTVPTLLQVFPVTTTPASPESLGSTADWVRHIGVFHLSRDRPPDGVARSWLAAGADAWVTAGVGDLNAAAHASWLPDGAQRDRVKALRPGQLWARSGASGRAVVVSVRRELPPIPLAWQLRLRGARRRRLSAARQMSTATESLHSAGGTRPDLYEKLRDIALLRTAWLRVSEGARDSHGVDGVSIAAFKVNEEAELRALAEDLAGRRYRPRPVRRVLVPKPDGQQRQLSIPCVRDRVVQTACLSLLDPIFEGQFSHFSFAFRPRRNARQAVTVARAIIAAGGRWAVIADIEKCFDRIDHDVLLDLVGRRVSDPPILALLQQWLTAEVLDFRDLLPTEVGVPQGSPLSPLLANVYLDPLDKHLEARGLDFVRYADDIVIFGSQEEDVLRALQVLGDYLEDPLRLNLKPAKTNHVSVDAGVDFLGFRLTPRTVEIQPGNLDRVLGRLRGLLTTLGAPTSSLLDRSRSLSHGNALVRGFRNYFTLPDEPAIAGQMRELERSVEQLAGELLPTPLSGDPAWTCRERFTPLGVGAREDTVPGLGAVAAGLGIYPEEHRLQEPAAWMTRDEIAAGPDQPKTATPAAAHREQSEDGSDPDGAGIVEHDGRLYLMTHGAYVTVEADTLVVRRRKIEICRRPLGEVGLIFLQGIGMNVSVALALACAERDVSVVIAPPVGNPMAVLSPIDSTRSHLRSRQVLRRNDPDVVAAGLRMIGAKLGNQASVLRYFAKYKRKVNPDIYKCLATASAEVRELAAHLRGLDPAAAGVRAAAMGLEGRGAAIYWRHLAKLLPAELGFARRATRGATDPVNQAINYVYGMLYGEVWRALAQVGLDPYFGLMHGSERDQGSLVFDLIEEFRAPFADRLVLAMIGRGMRPEVGRHGFLRTRIRRLLAQAFVRAWTRTIRRHGRMIAPSGILQQQAGALVKLITGQAEYRPFRMRW